MGVRIKPYNQRREPEGSNTSALRVLLLEPGDVPRDVLDGDRILNRQLVTLALDPRLVDEDPGVGLESRAGEGDVVVEINDLTDRSERKIKVKLGFL